MYKDAISEIVSPLIFILKKKYLAKGTLISFRVN